jgi:hypothetical protein
MFLLVTLVAAYGCHKPRRGPNVAIVGGIEIAPASAGGDGIEEAQTTGGLRASVQGAETDEDWVSAVGRIDVAAGGNGHGFAGRLTVDGQVGVALWDEDDHLFGRVGLFGTLETDPVTGYSALELPTLFLGYQHHGRDADDVSHIDVGPRFSLGMAGRASAPDGAHADFVFAPGAGAGVLVMGFAVTAELTYVRMFESSPVDVVRGSACFAALFAVCLDTRHIFADFGLTPGWDRTAYYGVRVGAGLALGTQ